MFCIIHMCDSIVRMCVIYNSYRYRINHTNAHRIRAATGANTAWRRACILKSLDLYTLAGVRASGSGRGNPRVIQYRFYMFLQFSAKSVNYTGKSANCTKQLRCTSGGRCKSQFFRILRRFPRIIHRFTEKL